MSESIKIGSQIGPFRIISQIGAGGMGVVYKAEDTRLRRTVAIKFIKPAATKTPGQSVERDRMEREARTLAGLSHPNVCVLHDVGDADGSFYLVMEFLEGETLRQVMQGKPLPPRKVMDYGAAMAEGLAAAHAKGILHRDLKPENLFLTTDGQIKILDFGLARLRLSAFESSPLEAETASLLTSPGTVLGTYGYMSPEQARGGAVDSRSDIFSLGAILYEMLTGQRPFSGNSPAELISSLLRDDPLDLGELSPQAPADLVRIVNRCLEKSPEKRFQSASDLAFNLLNLKHPISSSRALPASEIPLIKARKPYQVWGSFALAALILLAGGGFWVWTRSHAAMASVTDVQPLTFDRGFISSARFALGGQTVIYSAKFNDQPMQLYTTRLGSGTARAMHIPGVLASVARDSQLAILQNCQYGFSLDTCLGTLAVESTLGETPRPLLSNVLAADWGPRGKNLAVSHFAGEYQIEYPIGHVLFRSANDLTYLRISPDGKWLAFQDSYPSSDLGRLYFISTKTGKNFAIGPSWSAQEGLVWAPDSQSVYVVAGRRNYPETIYRIFLNGKIRQQFRLEPSLRLFDFAPHGKFLLTDEFWRTSSHLQTPSGNRNISWQDWSVVTDISPLGHKVLFCECDTGAAYVLSPGSSTPEYFGLVQPLSFSPDGRWILGHGFNSSTFQLLPLGTGQARILSPGNLKINGNGSWLADGKGIIFQGRHQGKPWRLYRQKISHGLPRPVSGPVLDYLNPVPSPDGRWVMIENPKLQWEMLQLQNGAVHLLPEIPSFASVMGWSKDSRSIYFISSSMPPETIFRLNWQTHQVKNIATIQSKNTNSISKLIGIAITPDGKDIAYSHMVINSHLLLVRMAKR